ncbi:MAG: NAD(P)/FAD-dependent oxidoreductase [Cyclobacteriaceae bacterium]
MQALNIPDIDLPRVIIIGGGFAGLRLARKLDPNHFQTVLIDSNNYHTFQPLMYQVATAGLEPDSIAYPLRKVLKNKKRTHIRMATVQEVVATENIIKTDLGDIRYDYLVVATGAKTNYFGNKNIEQHAIPMKNLTESLDLRSAILQSFEAALNEDDLNKRDSLMNFVIVGGGPTGVELAGALAELRKHVLPKDFPDLDLRRMQINLIEAGPKVLAAMSGKASENGFDYLKEMDINVFTNTMVNDYDGETVITPKHVIKSNNLIWAAGVKGNIPNGLEEKHLKGGRIAVDGYGFVNELDKVMAVGDVAIMKDERYDGGLPMLASVAQQQGDYLAKHLKNLMTNKTTKPFKYVDKGTMATVGRNRAVVDLGKVRFGGFFAWMTWLFVHLMLLVDFRNRIMVFANWVWSYVNFDRGTRLIVRKYEKEKKESVKRESQLIH